MDQLNLIASRYSVNNKVLLSYLCFLLFNIIYYLIFTSNWECYATSSRCGDIFYYTLNGDSTKAYIPLLHKLMNEGWAQISSGHWITYIYYF